MMSSDVLKNASDKVKLGETEKSFGRSKNDHLLLSFEHILEYLSHFRGHWDQESMIGLVHESLIVFDLIIELLFNVVFHFVRD